MSETALNRRLLDLEEVAAVLRITKRFVEMLVASGELESVLVGRRRLVEPAAIDLFLAQRKTAGNDVDFRVSYWRRFIHRYVSRLRKARPSYLTTSQQARLLAVASFLLDWWERDATTPKTAKDAQRLHRVSALATDLHCEVKEHISATTHGRRITFRVLSAALEELVRMLGEVQENV